jgi:hypothetical protein
VAMAAAPRTTTRPTKVSINHTLASQ